MRVTEEILAEQFDDLAQQQQASAIGMWTFLATEVLFFGGLFTAYIVYRAAYPQAFAEGSHHANVLLGTINTAILLTSSLTMAFAVHAAQQGDNRRIMRNLACTIALGLAFLAVKGIEYHQHISEHLFPGPSWRKDLSIQVELFYWLYWVMTALHALHVLVGTGLLSVIAGLAYKRRFSDHYYTPVEISGLYWHFVDIVWVFLYPLFYLIHK
jgi:cytochrome c oxidase subunit III